jgi:4,5-dihydroxyphthalate decarboxylase
MKPLIAAIGLYKHTEALFEDPLLRIEMFPTINRAFAPMVRTQRFDVSEIAIATFLMARAAGSDLVLLPVVLAARFQNSAFLRRAAHEFGPGDLAGRRIGVRAYSQTTGLWLRGSLQEDYGLQPDEVRWVTFEGAHVAGFRDPPWVDPAPAGSDMLDMLREGSLDAAIFGNHVPAAPDLTTVFPVPEVAGGSFFARHSFVPVNHLVVVRAAIARQEGLVRRLLDRFRAAGNPFPFGRAKLDPPIALAVRYAVEQGLLDRPLTLDDVWAGLPPDCDEAVTR